MHVSCILTSRDMGFHVSALVRLMTVFVSHRWLVTLCISEYGLSFCATSAHVAFSQSRLFVRRHRAGIIDSLLSVDAGQV